MFGTLVKGLRVGFELLQLLENEKQLFALFLKNFRLPLMRGSDGLDQFLTQFEAAIDSDFPNYQVFSFSSIIFLILVHAKFFIFLVS